MGDRRALEVGVFNPEGCGVCPEPPEMRAKGLHPRGRDQWNGRKDSSRGIFRKQESHG